MTATARAAGSATKPASGKLHCELDNWDFDPRYTDGACPICGWRPEGAAVVSTTAAPLNRIPWDLVLLVTLGAVLVVLGIVVGIQGKVNLLPH